MMADSREEEWELYNDGVLVYKRRKRHLSLPPSLPSEPQPDPESEEKNRRARKRRALLNLKDKYQNELDRWDHLSNSLCALEESVQEQEGEERRQEREERREKQEEDRAPSDVSSSGLSLKQRSMVDELLSKVVAEESIIRNMSSLCDISEALCNAEEERFTQTLFDLPIWGSSPRSLLASLCNDNEE